MLQAALEAYPHQLARDELSTLTDYKRSSRDAYIQRLQARRLLTSGPGPIRASDKLFRFAE